MSGLPSYYKRNQTRRVWQVQGLLFSCVMFGKHSKQYVVVILYLCILHIMEGMFIKTPTSPQLQLQHGLELALLASWIHGFILANGSWLNL